MTRSSVAPSASAPAAGAPTSSRAGAADPCRSRWYPWLFVAAFLVVIAVNGVMVTFAITSFAGLDTARPYERGLAYNETLAAARAQDALGWQVEYDVRAGDTAAAGRPIALASRFLDRDGRPIDGLAVRAVLRRPAVDGHDVEVALASAGEGRYAAASFLPLPGQWELRVVAIMPDGRSWQSSRRVLLP